MTGEQPDENPDMGYLVIGERVEPADEGFIANVDGDHTLVGYEPWTSISMGLALTAMAVGLAGILGLQAYIPALLLGIVGGLLLYEVGRLLLVHSEWRSFPVRAGRRLTRVVGLRPTADDSVETPPRKRP